MRQISQAEMRKNINLKYVLSLYEKNFTNDDEWARVCNFHAIFEFLRWHMFYLGMHPHF